MGSSTYTLGPEALDDVLAVFEGIGEPPPRQAPEQTVITRDPSAPSL